MQQSAKYELICNNQRVVFNDTTDDDFVGLFDDSFDLTAIGVRVTISDLPGEDGVYIGAAYLGGRSVSLSGQIWPDPIYLRKYRRDKLTAIIGELLNTDGILRWTELGGVMQQVTVRAIDVARYKYTNGPAWQFLCGLMAYNPRIFSQDEFNITITKAQDAECTLDAYNDGNMSAEGVIRITGPVTEPVIEHVESGKVIDFSGGTGLVLADGEYVEINLKTKRVLKDGTTNVYGKVLWPDSEIFLLDTGANTIKLTGGTGTNDNTSLSITYRHAWR